MARALLFKRPACRWSWRSSLAPLVAGAGALVFGWFCVRLSGVYLAMLTLAFAQIAWSVVFQWDELTGGSNGLVGVWPAAWLADKTRLLLPDAGAVRRRASLLLRRVLFSPFGYALRAGRDSPLRAEAIGIDVRARAMGRLRHRRARLRAWPVRCLRSPRAASRPTSIVDRAVGRRAGDGAAGRRPDADRAGRRRRRLHLAAGHVARETEYWRAVLGAVILLLVLRLPAGHRRRHPAAASRARWQPA